MFNNFLSWINLNNNVVIVFLNLLMVIINAGMLFFSWKQLKETNRAYVNAELVLENDFLWIRFINNGNIT